MLEGPCDAPFAGYKKEKLELVRYFVGYLKRKVIILVQQKRWWSLERSNWLFFKWRLISHLLIFLDTQYFSFQHFTCLTFIENKNIFINRCLSLFNNILKESKHTPAIRAELIEENRPSLLL